MDIQRAETVNTATTFAELQAVIRQVYHALSPTEKKLVHVLMSHQSHLATYNATELARLAGVSKSTTARVIWRLGFANYAQFRKQCRTFEPAGLSPLRNLEQRSHIADTLGSRLSVHLQREQQNIAAVEQNITSSQLEQVIHLLTQTRRVWVLGFRNSYASAFYAQSLFAHALSDVRFVNDPAVQFADVMAGIQPDDVLFVVVFPRQMRLVTRLISVAKEANATIVMLSNAVPADIHTWADIVIPCAAGGSDIFDSYTAAISMINFIGSELVAQCPAEATCRMQRMEAIHQQLDDLCPSADKISGNEHEF